MQKFVSYTYGLTRDKNKHVMRKLVFLAQYIEQTISEVFVAHNFSFSLIHKASGITSIPRVTAYVYYGFDGFHTRIFVGTSV